MDNQRFDKWHDHFLNECIEQQNRFADNFNEEDLEFKQTIHDEVFIDSLYSVALAIAMLAKVIQEK